MKQQRGFDPASQASQNRISLEPGPGRPVLVIAFSTPAAAGHHGVITLQQAFASAHASMCLNCTCACNKT
jgi:hypothetical protein